MSEVSLMSIGQWHETYGKASRASVEGMITQFDKVLSYVYKFMCVCMYAFIYKYKLYVCIYIYIGIYVYIYICIQI
jgi:hypothetical protein